MEVHSFMVYGSLSVECQASVEEGQAVRGTENRQADSYSSKQKVRMSCLPLGIVRLFLHPAHVIRQRDRCSVAEE